MGFREIFAKKRPVAEDPETPLFEGPADPPATERDDSYFDMKHRIHSRLIDEIHLPALDPLGPQEIFSEIRPAVERQLAEENILFNDDEIRALVMEIVNELKGFGPLEPLLQDATVSDILCNSYRQVYVERFGLLEKTSVRFRDDDHLMTIIDRIVSRIGRRIDESSPMVDARLPDGSRVNAIIPPLAIDGPSLSIRRFAVHPLHVKDLVRNQTLTDAIAKLLQGCVKARLNILISGGTGAGKTTLLNVLSSFIPDNERIITIEDSAELQMRQEHVVRLETRPPNIEGLGTVNQRDLVRNSLRMRPDRIVIGEVRGAEAFDMLQAMNTGHEGSLGTIHANTPRDSLTRMESMILTTGFNLPQNAMRFMLSSALDMIIQISRFPDGTRKIKSITEVVGMEGEIITLQDIFIFDKKGIDPNGKVIGQFKATGIRPKFAEKLEVAGIEIPENLFCSFP